MAGIGDILKQPQLNSLRKTFESPEGEKQIKTILRGVLPELYPHSKSYVAAINSTYFDGAARRKDPGNLELDPDDRERCIIALLASQGAQFTLAMHIYLGLMLGVTPQEISHVILLSGVYTGAGRFTDGMMVNLKTLQTLADLTGDLGPAAATKALQATFGVSLAPQPQKQP